MFISSRSVENCISVERLGTFSTDLRSILQNIKKIGAGLTRSILSNTRSNRSYKFCREFSEFFHIDNHIQNRCSKKSSKIHGKTPLLESLFNNTAGLRPAILIKILFCTDVFQRILKNFWEHLFCRTPLDDCLSNIVQISLH